jgi:uracil-DNA glycosylase family 4
MSSTPRPPSCARAPRLTPRAIVQKTAAYVRAELTADASGHDAWHAWRVWRTAVRIARRTKGADAFVVQLAALLHDIADWKLHGGDASIGPARARAWLARFPLDRRTVFIGNVLHCRPPENRVPLPHEVEQSSPFLHRQLDALRPRVVCCLGKTAGEHLLGVKATLGSMRNQVHRFRGAKLIVTYHPAAVLRNPELKRPVWEDMQLLAREYQTD